MLSAVTPLIAQETVLVTHKLAVFATLLAAIVGMGGCSFPERGPAVPQADTSRALPLGIPNARFFADGDPKPMIEEGMRALEREEAALRAAGAARPGQGWREVAAGELPRRVRRRRQRRLRRRPDERLDGNRDAARIQDGDRRQHRRPDRALRLPRIRLRRHPARGLHDHDPREGLSRPSASCRRPVRRRHGRHRAARAGDRALRRPEDVRRHRARVPEGPPADDRHHRSRCPAPRHLEHRRAGGQRAPWRAGPFPQDPARLGGDPRRLPARADRCRARRPQVSGNARRWRRDRPALPLSGVDRSLQERRSPGTARLHHPQCPARSRL